LADRTDYETGFIDGFVDYVFAGGNGEPPPVPPRRLWNVYFRSEEGHLRAADWFTGYRHGAGYARDGGYRELSTIRSSLFGFEDRDEAAYFSSGQATEHGAPAYDDAPDSELLPVPDLTLPAAPHEATPSEADHRSLESKPSQAPTGLPPLPPPARPPQRDLAPENLHELDLRGDETESSLNTDDHRRATEEGPPAQQKEAPPTLKVPQAESAPERIPFTIPPGANESKPPITEPVAPEPTSSSVRLFEKATVASTEQPPQLAPSPQELFRTPFESQDKPERGTSSKYPVQIASATVENSSASEVIHASTIEILPGPNVLRSPILLKTGPAPLPHAR
jgi:hypothetical protein